MSLNAIIDQDMYTLWAHAQIYEITQKKIDD